MNALTRDDAREEVSVIIPALDEEEAIGQVVSSMPWDAIAECIVVDNGSRDRTADRAAAAGARVISSPKGYGAACAAGVRAALPGSSVLVFMDGDGSDVVADMARLLAPILDGEADFVIGSRLCGQRQPGSMLPSQVFAGHAVAWLLRLLHGFRYTDMGPFRAIRRACLEELKMSEMTYGWNLEMQVKAASYKLRIREIAVDYECRKGGVSKVSGDLQATLKTGWRILAVLFRTSKAGTRERGARAHAQAE